MNQNEHAGKGGTYSISPTNGEIALIERAGQPQPAPVEAPAPQQEPAAEAAKPAKKSSTPATDGGAEK